MTDTRDNLYQEILSTMLFNDNIGEAKAKLYHILGSYNIAKIEYDPNIYDLRSNIEKYLRDKTIQGISPKTIRNYRYVLMEYCLFNNKKLQHIIRDDILDYFEYIRKNNTSVKESSLETIRYILLSFFNWAKECRIIDESPMSKIKPFKVERRIGQTLTIAELETIRDGCDNIRDRAIVEVAYSTGCRLSELVSIDRDQIDWQNKRFKVIGKGNAERYVFLSERALIHLTRYLNSREDTYPSLFITRRGEPKRLSHRSIEDAVDRIAKKCGLEKKISPHVFRRSLLTNLATNECPIMVIKEIAGHSNVTTTQQYINITPEFKQQSFRKYLYQ